MPFGPLTGQEPLLTTRAQYAQHPPALTDDAFDVGIRFGAPPDTRVIARHIAPNRRLLCASPTYLAEHGILKVPNDLVRHNCIGIRQGEEVYGLWRLSSGRAKAQKPKQSRPAATSPPMTAKSPSTERAMDTASS